MVEHFSTLTLKSEKNVEIDPWNKTREEAATITIATTTLVSRDASSDFQQRLKLHSLSGI